MENTLQPIDVIVTSYKRWDLLQITLDSFFEFNTYPINRIFIHEDFGSTNFSEEETLELVFLTGKYGEKTFFLVDPYRKGQIKALDELMTWVKTPYYFTIEDDWQFIKKGFIEESLKVLESDEKIIQLWLRGSDRNHPAELKKGMLRLTYDFSKIWHGFSFNPALRRLEDYKKIGSYSSHTSFNPKSPYKSEAAIGDVYKKLGYYAVTTEQQYVKHIGDGRGIRQ